jgi:hypothetical protein
MMSQPGVAPAARASRGDGRVWHGQSGVPAADPWRLLPRGSRSVNSHAIHEHDVGMDGDTRADTTGA